MKYTTPSLTSVTSPHSVRPLTRALTTSPVAIRSARISSPLGLEAGGEPQELVGQRDPALGDPGRTVAPSACKRSAGRESGRGSPRSDRRLDQSFRLLAFAVSVAAAAGVSSGPEPAQLARRARSVWREDACRQRLEQYRASERSPTASGPPQRAHKRGACKTPAAVPDLSRSTRTADDPGDVSSGTLEITGAGARESCLGADSTSASAWSPRFPASKPHARTHPLQQTRDPRMAAKQRVAAPDRIGERLWQLTATALPSGELVAVALQRHRGDAARAAATAREANQRPAGAPPLQLLPHLLVAEQLPAGSPQPHRVRLAGFPAGRRVTRLTRLGLAGRAGPLTPPARRVQQPSRLAAGSARLAAQPAPRVTQRTRLRKPQSAVAHRTLHASMSATGDLNG